MLWVEPAIPELNGSGVDGQFGSGASTVLACRYVFWAVGIFPVFRNNDGLARFE